MSGVAGVLDGLMRPRHDVHVSPPSTLENLKITATSTAIAKTIV